MYIKVRFEEHVVTVDVPIEINVIRQATHAAMKDVVGGREKVDNAYVLVDGSLVVTNAGLVGGSSLVSYTTPVEDISSDGMVEFVPGAKHVYYSILEQQWHTLYRMVIPNGDPGPSYRVWYTGTPDNLKKWDLLGSKYSIAQFDGYCKEYPGTKQLTVKEAKEIVAQLCGSWNGVKG